jgi:hypothetical protein
LDDVLAHGHGDGRDAGWVFGAWATSIGTGVRFLGAGMEGSLLFDLHYIGGGEWLIWRFGPTVTIGLGHDAPERAPGGRQ